MIRKYFIGISLQKAHCMIELLKQNYFDPIFAIFLLKWLCCYIYSTFPFKPDGNGTHHALLINSSPGLWAWLPSHWRTQRIISPTSVETATEQGQTTSDVEPNCSRKLSLAATKISSFRTRHKKPHIRQRDDNPPPWKISPECVIVKDWFKLGSQSVF